MTAGRAALLFATSVLAGGVNSVAGGGTLLSFPAAIAAGLSPIVANATNAVALVPGSLAAAWAYRRYLVGLGRLTAALSVPAIAGALLGARILLYTPQRLFDGVVPWLVLGATTILLVQGLMARSRNPRASSPPGPPPEGGILPGEPRPIELRSSAHPAPSRPVPRWTRWPVVLGLQFLVSIYGGYFGAAMGILMLAFLGHVTPPNGQGRLNLHQMNAVKNVLAVSINAAASMDFITHGLVRPGPAFLMASGAVAGGIAGGRIARRARPAYVRDLVVAIGFAMAALLAWRRYG